MDLAYLRAHPETVPRLIEHQRIRITPLAHGPGGRAERWTLDDGTDLFAKVHTGAPAGFFAAEAEGLRWLALPGVIGLPEVIAVTSELIATTWIDEAPPSAGAAASFGRDLAALHRSGAPSFGFEKDGWLATLPLPNTPTDDWPTFYTEYRCRPYLRLAYDAGTLRGADAAAVERALDRVPALAGPPEPPSRIHGDLWAGNVLFGLDGRGWLVDPAAHGGHRETDLAMLAMFGTPWGDRILGAYNETWPLADGWRDRVPLHQLHPLLTHCVLYGTSYLAQTVATARQLD